MFLQLLLLSSQARVIVNRKPRVRAETTVSLDLKYSGNQGMCYAPSYGAWGLVGSSPALKFSYLNCSSDLHRLLRLSHCRPAEIFSLDKGLFSTGP